MGDATRPYVGRVVISAASRQKGNTQGASAGATWHPSGKWTLRHDQVYFPGIGRLNLMSRCDRNMQISTFPSRAGDVPGAYTEQKSKRRPLEFRTFENPRPPTPRPPTPRPTLSAQPRPGPEIKMKIRTFQKSQKFSFPDIYRGKRKTEVSRRRGRGYIARKEPLI